MKNKTFKQCVRKARWLLTITLLFFLGVGQMWARTVYFDTDGLTFKGNATNFAIYLWGGGDGDEWHTLEHVSGNIYSAEVSDSRVNCIFCSMSSHTTGWNYKTGQTDDQTSFTSNNYFTVTNVNLSGNSDGKISGSWSLYSATPSVSLGASPTSVECGASVTFTATGNNLGGESATYKFEDITGGGSSVIQAASSTNTCTTSWATAGTKTVQVTMSVGGNDYTDTKSVTVVSYIYFYAAIPNGWDNRTTTVRLTSSGSSALTPYDNTSLASTTKNASSPCVSVYSAVSSTSYYNSGAKYNVYIYKVLESDAGKNVYLGHSSWTFRTAIGTVAAGKLYTLTSGDNGGTYMTANAISVNSVTASGPYAINAVSLTSSISAYGTSTANLRTAGGDTFTTTYTLNDVTASTSTVITPSVSNTYTSNTGNLVGTITIDEGDLTAGHTYTLTVKVADNITGKMTSSATSSSFAVTAASTATLTYHANWYTEETSGDVPAAQVVAKDRTAIVAGRNTLAMTNYTFSGWNTEEYITGTSYAVGSSITMDEDKNLYAVWTRSITLNQNGATKNGTTSVTGTYNCSTLPSITNPQKTGYDFVGWRTENDGTGNPVINTSGELQPGVYHWTDRTTPSNRFQRNPSSTTPLYATWTQTVSLKANTANHGSGTDKTGTATWNGASISIPTHCSAATGYSLDGYYTAATGGTKIINADKSFAGSDITVNSVPYISSSKWVHPGATTLYAQYTANTYTVTLAPNGGSGSNQTVTATYDAAMPDALSGGGSIVAPELTGYNFGGYWYSTTQYYDGNLNSVTNWNRTSATTLTAKWTAKQYTITLDKQTSAAGYGGSAGTVSNPTVTYNTTLTSVSGTMPTAANGYCFMGFYSAANGVGRRFIAPDGTWVTSAGDTISGGKWMRDGAITLYAYYKKAEITDLDVYDAIVAPNTLVVVTPTVSPVPEGDVKICWELQYNNGTIYPTQPTFIQGPDNSVRFAVPTASGSYRVQAQLSTTHTCGSGTVLSTRSTGLTLAGEHDVTIYYKYNGTNIKASEVIEGIKPLEWSENITAPEIFGYTFARWDAGDGVTIKNGDSDPVTTSTEATIKIEAIYDGALTAVYNKKDLIYFNNTLGWEHVYVYFYDNDKYWDPNSNGKGAGAQHNYAISNHAPHWYHVWGEMTKVEGEENIYYFDYQAKAADNGESNINSYTNVVFTKDAQGWTDDSHDGYEFFDNTQAVRRTDFDHGMSMYVPIKANGIEKNVHGSSKTIYYNNGYWMNYPESTGYTLNIFYDSYQNRGTGTAFQSVQFPFNSDKTMPMAVTLDLEAGQLLYYEVVTHHVSSKCYGNNGNMSDASGSKGPWPFYDANTTRCGIRTTASGDYTFNWDYFNGADGYQYYMTVDYPAKIGDYRIKYTDDDHTGGHARYSRVISKREEGEDLVSFFIATDKHYSFAIESVSGINAGTGAVSWGPVAGKSVTTTAVDGSKIYNIKIEQDADGVITSAAVVGEYEGNFYIRTDCAASKWNNYRYDPGNLMTYSEYAANKTGSDFTHYFMGHANSGNNVKFVIANDYSPNISDTLYQMAGDLANTHVNVNGEIQANANIRFMWDKRNNTVLRAYLADAKSDGTEYLVLQGEAGTLLDENGNALLHDADEDEPGYNHEAPNNAIQFSDTENWMYEAKVKATPGGFVKLYAKFHGGTFYFYGDSDSAFDDTHAIQLITGTGDDEEDAKAQLIRVIYDFKTDRLIAAWLPTDEEISSEKTINADIMLVREHQDAGKQINLTGSGSIVTDKTVYGVMRFNRYKLHNRSTEGEHSILPVGDQKSQYERFNYFISFPFNVNVGEIFGIGTAGTDWRIFRYDGLGRAQEGYFQERGDSNWRSVTSGVLNAYEGYLLQLNYIRLGYDKTGAGQIWANNKEEIELYFPAADVITTIDLQNVVIGALSDAYKCTIDLSAVYEAQGHPHWQDADRQIKDSYWRCIGVPGFTSKLETASTWTNFNWAADVEALPYLYEWEMEDNSLSVVSASTFTFKPMHAYLIQNGNSFTWTNVAQPHNVAARRAPSAEESGYYEFRIEMRNDENTLDQTYVRLMNSDDVTNEFDFGQDLSKELNTKYNIFTKVGYERLAANMLPISDQTTIIPLGVKVSESGLYTLSIPEGTQGVGVTLIDNETGARTSLSALEYSIYLTAGDHNERFMLEISPISSMPTEVEALDSQKSDESVRKVIIDGVMYIIREGKMYDARGAMVK